MKKLLFVGNRPVAIDEMEVGYVHNARVECVMEVSDFPEHVNINTGISESGRVLFTKVRTESFAKMLCVLAFDCGEKIPAIKLAKQVLDLGLKDAKFFVESLEHQEDERKYSIFS